MKDEFHNLLAKEMDRRDFLKHVGVGVVALTGAAAFLKTLNGVTSGSLGSGTRRTSGYGASAYGGNKLAKNKQ